MPGAVADTVADPGTLYLVSTPIGHLDDLGERARQVLATVDVIACEDTRVTAKLLRRYEIMTRTLSYHAHNENHQADHLVRLLQDGRSAALVSDAGTPCLSDPGTLLVKRVHAASIPVVPVPGPSALLAALAASGLPPRPFTFAGFLPSRGGERRRALQTLSLLPHTLVLFESPHRLVAALADMAVLLGPRDAAVCRELTKLHEEVIVDRLDRLAQMFRSRGRVRGEITVVIGPPEGPPPTAKAGLPDLDEHYRSALERTGGDRKEALRLLARERGSSRRAIYRALLGAGVMGDTSDR